MSKLTSALKFIIGLTAKHPLYLIIFLFFLTPTLYNSADAQTCRVSMGTNSNGHKCYMEVYEYDFVSEKPCFPGGDCKLMEFINKNRVYPDKAYNQGIQGKVTCSFVVNTNGAISHLKILKSVEQTLNNEALRILGLMPDWIPGKIEGQPVPVRVIWSVPFRK